MKSTITFLLAFIVLAGYGQTSTPIKGTTSNFATIRGSATTMILPGNRQKPDTLKCWFKEAVVKEYKTGRIIYSTTHSTDTTSEYWAKAEIDTAVVERWKHGYRVIEFTPNKYHDIFPNGSTSIIFLYANKRRVTNHIIDYFIEKK